LFELSNAVTTYPAVALKPVGAVGGVVSTTATATGAAISDRSIAIAIVE
jgi:hypothetical protein